MITKEITTEDFYASDEAEPCLDLATYALSIADWLNIKQAREILESNKQFNSIESYYQGSVLIHSVDMKKEVRIDLDYLVVYRHSAYIHVYEKHTNNLFKIQVDETK